MIRIQRFVAGAYGVNCYLVYDEETLTGYLIDPADKCHGAIQFVKENNLSLLGILLTHGHGDHIQGVPLTLESFEVPIYIHEADAYRTVSANVNMSSQMPGPAVEFVCQQLLKNGDMIPIGAHQISVLHTPGHTEGCVCFNIGDYSFTGDTLFASGIGRTDLSGGNYEQLLESLALLMTLDDSITILPGHGGSSTIGRERQTNPYCRG